MAIPIHIQDREKQKFVESTAVANKTAVAVVNPDGTNLGGGTGTSANQVQGTAADNAVAVGNPVRVGHKYNSSTQTYADGDIADFQADANGNSKVTLATAVDEDIDSITAYVKGFTKVKLSADGVVLGTPCVVGGYYVGASSVGIISLYDNASAATGDAIIANAKTVTANELVTLSQPVIFDNGCFFDLVSGTATVYVFVRKVTLQ
jgi:hypothetical protein